MSSKNSIDKAYDILKTYEGKNNRILYLQRLYSLGQCVLGDFDVEYILNNYDFEPYMVGKTVKITREYGLKLQQKYELDFCPEKIRISSVIGEMGNSLHCYVQYRQSVPSQLMYVNKNSILNELEDIDWQSFEVDFTELDKKIIGFNKGEISLWSGRNGSAKSTVLNQICLNACQEGFKCAIFSGELTKQRIKQWIQLQAAGKQNVSPSKKYENLFYVPQQTGEKIDKWLDGKLWIYDNAFGNKFESVLNYLKELVESKNIDMIVLDNLMALDILTLNGDKYQQQTTMILALVDFVKTYNVHLHIVCHPRKAATFLRKDDISGTADLTNAVDNVFIIHRVGNDFVQSAKDFYGDAYASKFYGFGNVIEVCKNRDLGIMDELFGFFFETQSKRLLNDVFENVCYGWEESPTRFFNEENMQFVSFTELPFDVDEEWEDGDLPY